MAGSSSPACRWTPTPAAGAAFGGLSAQDEIAIHDAELSWTDELRGAAALELEKVEARLINDRKRHRFGLTARPPSGLAGRLSAWRPAGSDPRC